MTRTAPAALDWCMLKGVSDSYFPLDFESELCAGVPSQNLEIPALLIAWAAEEPDRVGDVCLFEPSAASHLLGRGDSTGQGRVSFFRQRPGSNERRPGLQSSGLSRDQLRIRLAAGRLTVERIGRCALTIRGQRVDKASVEPGDRVLLQDQILFLCTRRPRKMLPLQNEGALQSHGFGMPDSHGLVGESPALWQLRDDLAAKSAAPLDLSDRAIVHDDIPLLARHWLMRTAEQSPERLSRFLDAEGRPRTKASLFDALLHAPTPIGLSTLVSLLERAVSESPGDAIEWAGPLPA